MDNLISHTIERTFSLQNIAELTGASRRSVQGWAARRNRASGGLPGSASQTFSWSHLMEVAIGSALVDVGLPSRDAFTYAGSFAHVSRRTIKPRQVGRKMGVPCHHLYGDTLFAVGAGPTCEVVGPSKAVQNQFEEVSHHLGGIRGFVLINASAIFNKICFRLSVGPHELLDALYPAEAERYRAADSVPTIHAPGFVRECASDQTGYSVTRSKSANGQAIRSE